MTQLIGQIEALKWSKTSKASDFTNWFKIFECTLVINKIDPTKVEQALQAKAMLYAYGGEKIRLACDSFAGYATLTYAETTTRLQAYFKQETTKLDSFMFIASKPNEDEKLSDYAARLQLLYKATGLPDDKCDAMTLTVIAVHTTNSDLRAKAMETSSTLKTTLEWQAMNEISEQLESSAAVNSETIRRTFTPRDSRSKRQSSKKSKRSESEKRRYNEQQQRLNGCYWCGEKFPHAGGSKCLGLTSTCKYCKAKGHLEKACLAKKREEKRKTATANYLNESSDYSRRLGKSADECPRAVVSLDDEDAEHVLDSGANVNIMTNRTFHARKVKPKLTKYKRRLYAYHTKQEVAVLGQCEVVAQINGVVRAVTYIVLKDDDVQSENIFGYKACKDFKLIVMADCVRICSSGIHIRSNKRSLRSEPKPIGTKHTKAQPNKAAAADAETEVKLTDSEETIYATIRPEATSQSKLSKMAAEPEPIDSIKARIMRDYAPLFENRIGKMKDAKVHLDTDPKVIPKQRRHFPVPYCLVPSTQKKLSWLILNEIIEEVPEGANITHISPMHPVEKANYDPEHYKNKECEAHSRKRCRKCISEADMEKIDIRITSDNSDNLNKAIIKQTRPMPSVSTLKYELNGAKLFSKVDIRDVFLTIELDDESKDLTTFSTSWGLYRYKRLNMGLCVASELFQETLTQKLAGLRNIKVAMDDVLVFGKTDLEHDEALEALLKRILELNIRRRKV